MADAPIDPMELPPPPDGAAVEPTDLKESTDPIDPHGRIRGQIDAIANGAESTAGGVDSLRNAIKSVNATIDNAESALARIWLREIQDQNQKVQIAFAELEAAKLVTKTKKATHDEEVQKLTKLIADQKQMQDDWSRPLPLFDGANGHATVVDPAIRNDSATDHNANGKTGPLTDAQISEAWKFASIAELNLPGKLPELLEENGITTIGDLEAKRATYDGLRGIKGIGQAKVDLIENAVTDWLSVQRDAKAMAEAGSMAGIQGVITSEDPVAAPSESTVAAVDPDTHSTATTFVAEQDGPPEFDDI